MASASRKAAMAEIKDSEAAYKEKIEALGTATADTWDSAKQNVISAWDHLASSIARSRTILRVGDERNMIQPPPARRAWTLTAPELPPARGAAGPRSAPLAGLKQ
jgi:hypothetical protein